MLDSKSLEALKRIARYPPKDILAAIAQVRDDLKLPDNTDTQKEEKRLEETIVDLVNKAKAQSFDQGRHKGAIEALTTVNDVLKKEADKEMSQGFLERLVAIEHKLGLDKNKFSV